MTVLPLSFATLLAPTMVGKNPFSLDCKAPTGDYKAFMMREVRYNSLARQNPAKAEVLFNKAVENSKKRYDDLVGLIDYYKPAE